MIELTSSIFLRFLSSSNSAAALVRENTENAHWAVRRRELSRSREEQTDRMSLASLIAEKWSRFQPPASFCDPHATGAHPDIQHLFFLNRSHTLHTSYLPACPPKLLFLKRRRRQTNKRRLLLSAYCVQSTVLSICRITLSGRGGNCSPSTEVASGAQKVN